jgi:hypothetical protein
MSIGVFLGIRAATSDADAVLEGLAEALQAANLPAYEEPSREDVEKRYLALRKRAKCKRDSLTTRGLTDLRRRIVGAKTGQGLVDDLSEGAVFAPGEFSERVPAPRLPLRCVWSTGALVQMLRRAALPLGLPLSNGELTPAILAKVNAGRRLGKWDVEDDDNAEISIRDDVRPMWLTLYEFAKLAHSENVAFMLS